jgi:transcriptional regulator with XRE-family HTH domain
MSIADKVKTLRNQKGYSQEKLAEKTGLSLRTIQRVENSETEPRGDTLSKIADVFKVSPDEIMEQNIEEDNSYLMVLNLTQFISIIIPLFGILFPMLLWTLKRRTVSKVEEVGKKILNFQITWSIFVLSGLVVWNVYTRSLVFRDIEQYFTSYQNSLISFWVFAGMAIFYNVGIIVSNTLKIKKGKQVFFKPAIPFLR